jgi:hypothetical protein
MDIVRKEKKININFPILLKYLTLLFWLFFSRSLSQFVWCSATSKVDVPGSSVGIATGYGLDGPGIESRWGARFFTPVQTGPVADPASCRMGTGSFPGLKNGRGVTLTPHPLLVPRSWKVRAIPLLPLWAVRPVQSLSACTGVHFTFLPILTSSKEKLYKGCPIRYLSRHFFIILPLMRILQRNLKWTYRHIPLHFSHNELTPVQISLQYLHFC